MVRDFIAMFVGVFFMYFCGLLWFKIYMNCSWEKSIAVAFLPFIIPDIIKIIIACPVIVVVRQIMYPKMLVTTIIKPKENLAKKRILEKMSEQERYKATLNIEKQKKQNKSMRKIEEIHGKIKQKKNK